MKEIHPSLLDLNLLSVFVAVMRERSATKAALHLGSSQSAVSHALGRLRRTTGDPLFVRTGHLFEPTQRAIELFDVVGPALSAIETELRAARHFDPALAQNTFRIGLSDDLQIALLPHLLARLRSTAPSATLIVKTTDYLRASDMLVTADVSLVIGYLEKLPAQAKIRRLRKARYRVLMAERPRLLLGTYCSAKHVLVTFAGDLKGYIDESLEKLGRSRTVALSLPQFASLPHVLVGSSYIATVPDHIARAFTVSHGLKDQALPFPSPSFDVSIAWRAEVANDPAEAWLRDQIFDCVAQSLA